MAERRMFAKTIIDSDLFLDMPLSTQALYFHLSMRGDDDGFLNNASKITKMIGANRNDFDLLLLKKFVITFESGIVVIKHWKIHNYIQKDRYKETVYHDEKSQLDMKSNGSYTMKENLLGIEEIQVIEDDNHDCIQNGYSLDTQVRLGKVSIGKDSIEKNSDKKSRFTPPSLEELKRYCGERNNKIDPEAFIDFYDSNGWMVGKNKMKDWKASVRTWEKRDNSHGSNTSKYKKQSMTIEKEKKYTDEELEQKLLNRRRE